MSEPHQIRGRKLVRWPSGALKRKARPVTVFGAPLQGVIEDLLAIMQVMPEEAAGLAATQLDADDAVFVVSGQVAGTTEPVVFVNPVIEYASPDTEVQEEGCLSLPGERVKVKRSVEVRVKAQDRNGQEFTVTAAGFYARCVQHEVDHLNGISLFDKAGLAQRERIRRKFGAGRR